MSKKVVCLILSIIVFLIITIPSLTKCEPESSNNTSSSRSYKVNSFNYGLNNKNNNADVLSITDKSSVNLTIGDSVTTSFENTGSHALISNILLPKGTNITLIDKVNNNVYEYSITTSSDNYNYQNNCDSGNCKAVYYFSLFKEKGKKQVVNYTEENTLSNEEFNIIVDFENATIAQDYKGVMLYVELLDSSNNVIKITDKNTIKTFDILINCDAELKLNSGFKGSINYNNVETNTIELTSKLEYKNIDNEIVYDSTFNDKKMGLAIKVVNQNGNVVSREYYKNIIFKYEDKIYYPGSDNITRIKISNNTSEVKKSLVIETYGNNSLLENGTYYLKISNYSSYDGYSYNKLGSEISIPLNVYNKPSKADYGFDVKMDNINYIVSRNNQTQTVNFNISHEGNFSKANVIVSLYKKDKLTAYNQDYSIIDLKEFVTNDLEKFEDNKYIALNELTFDVPLLENNGYKLVFELYDNDKKIQTIEKYFIVK